MRKYLAIALSSLLIVGMVALPGAIYAQSAILNSSHFDFTSSNGGWSQVSGRNATYNSGSGWYAVNYMGVEIQNAVDIDVTEFDVSASVSSSGIEMIISSSNCGYGTVLFDTYYNGTHSFSSPLHVPAGYYFCTSTSGWSATVANITISGYSTSSPFGLSFPTLTPTIAAPTVTPTPGAATLPGLLPSPGLTMTWIQVYQPTNDPNGIFGQAGLYTAPTAVALVGTPFNWGFGLSNEVSLANGAISMYKTANSSGAINILLWLFLAFGGLSLLYALIKKLGDR